MVAMTSADAKMWTIAASSTADTMMSEFFCSPVVPCAAAITGAPLQGSTFSDLVEESVIYLQQL